MGIVTLSKKKKDSLYEQNIRKIDSLRRFRNKLVHGNLINKPNEISN